MWVDTHCHLQLADHATPQELLDRAPDVDWLVVPGIDLATSQQSIELCATDPERLLPTAGLHPHDADSWSEQRDAIAELLPSVRAVGETGLDFYRNLAHRDAQLESFREHVALAAIHDLPLIVHCRDAFKEVFEILEHTGEGPRTVLHCWTGGPKWSRRFLDLGVTFSFAGPVAFASGETTRLAAAVIPPERTMLETDTPYLAPEPHRSEPNEPAWVALNGTALAGVWGMEVEEVARITSENAARVFGR
jgi:TatD DNase family protein